MSSSPPASRAARPFDLVLWGATGFTGRLAAAHLVAHHGGTGVRFALAGRSRGKLEALRSELLAENPGIDSVELRVADAGDLASMRALVREARVVATTVGPFAKVGEGLVAACAEEGTDYCDITGEPHFIRKMIDRYEARARETGARLVPTCGFDSIPSDLGTLLLQEAIHERTGRYAREVRFFAGDSKAGFSGGTLASLLNALDEARVDREVRAILLDPYALCPEGMRQGPDSLPQRGVGHDDSVGAWTAPFVMAAINTLVVRRSHALLGRPWGHDFRYSEQSEMGSGVRGWARASGLSLGLGAFMAAAMSPWLRTRLMKKLPSQGEGPSRERRARSYFRIRLSGLDERGRVLGTARVEGGDPGYDETAKMIVESALVLMGSHERGGGFWTPATAMGLALVARLRTMGMVFEAEPVA